MRRPIAIALVAALAALPSAAGAAPKPVTVFEDPSGDSGNQDQGAPGASELGVDLVGGTIAKDGDNVVFTVTHAAMPPPGSLPEAARFLWHFQVDGEEWRVTVKSFDIGKPDVVAGTGTERVGQVYTEGIYRLEQCVEDSSLPVTLVNCNPTDYLEGAFDPAAKTLTFNIPLETVKAKVGSTIQGGTSGNANSSCMICWVPHYAERSLTPVTVIDSAIQTVAYKVPKK